MIDARTGSKARLTAIVRWAQWRRSIRLLLIHLVLLAGVVLTGAPYLYTITGSFKENSEIFSLPLRFWPQEPTLTNYQRLLSGSEIPFLRQMGNSAVVAVAQTALTLLVVSMVGWGFAKYEFAGKRVLFLALLATLTIPFQVTLVPLFLLMLRLRWVDTYWAIVLPGAVNAFGAFFMRQAMLAVPRDLLDAARIDGASEWGLFWRIGLPLSRSALGDGAADLCLLMERLPVAIDRAADAAEVHLSAGPGHAGGAIQGGIRDDPGRCIPGQPAGHSALRRW